MLDVVGIGELLIDFTCVGASPEGLLLFERNPGGAVCNMLCTVARFGGSAAFVGKVGKDMQGEYLKRVVKDAGVDVSNLAEDERVYTTLSFVALDEDGERDFSFARKPGADTCLRLDELDAEKITDCKILHFGSLSLTDEPARTTTLEIVRLARERGAIVSLDPNYRASLWKSGECAKAEILAALKNVDIIKISEEEAEMLTGSADMPKAAEALHAYGISCAVITLGKDGAFLSLRGKGSVTVPGARDGLVVDKTGAGDIFWGAFISRFLAEGGRLDTLTLRQTAAFATFANMAATLSLAKRGGIPSIPVLAEVEDALRAETANAARCASDCAPKKTKGEQ